MNTKYYKAIFGVLVVSVPLMVPHWVNATADVYGETEEPSQDEINEAVRSISTTPSTASTGSVISTACPVTNQVQPGSQFSKDCSNLVVDGAFAPEGSVSNGEATHALSVITADQAIVPLSSSRSSLSTQLQNLSARLGALRGGATGISLRGLTIGGAASADDGSAFLNDGRLGVFINGTISSGDKDATTNEEGFDFDAWGISAGVDYRFRDNLVAGIAAGYSKNDTDIDNRSGSLDTDSYSVSLYGTYYHDERAYIDAVLTYGSSDYDQQRNIRYTIADYEVNQIASADYDGSQWSGTIGFGYDIPQGPWTFGPAASIQYLSADVDGYNERMSAPTANGGGWAARLDDLNQESFSTTIGGNVSRAVSTTWGVLLPHLHLSWVHEFKNDATSVNGNFIQDPTNGAFGIRSDSPDSDYFNARLGLSAQFAAGNSAFFYYNKVFGYRDLSVDTFGAGARFEF